MTTTTAAPSALALADEAAEARRQALVAACRAAEPVVIRAQSMLYAQAATLTPEARATLTLRADRDRAEFGETDLQPVNVDVRDRDGARLGHVTYML